MRGFRQSIALARIIHSRKFSNLIPFKFVEEKTGKIFEVKAPKGKSLLDISLGNVVQNGRIVFI